MTDSPLLAGSRPVVGVLHPGAMGAAIGSALKPVAGQVVWAAEGRSDATAKRAELADLVALPDVEAVARHSDVIVSICPPHAAVEVAARVARALDGADRRPRLYVDANATSPATMRRVAGLLGAERVVDGAVIGGPAWTRGDTVLWLSGERAHEAAALFAGSPFEARVIGAPGAAVLGAASALKACFALRSKAVPALLLEVAAMARVHGVEAELTEQLGRVGVDFADLIDGTVRGTSAKAWRWVGEMTEAADALVEAGLPDGFSRAAAEVYDRLAGAADAAGPGLTTAAAVDGITGTRAPDDTAEPVG